MYMHIYIYINIYIHIYIYILLSANKQYRVVNKEWRGLVTSVRLRLDSQSRQRVTQVEL